MRLVILGERMIDLEKFVYSEPIETTVKGAEAAYRFHFMGAAPLKLAEAEAAMIRQALMDEAMAPLVRYLSDRDAPKKKRKAAGVAKGTPEKGVSGEAAG